MYSAVRIDTMNSLRAVQAYQRIVDALRNAELAARNASRAATNAYRTVRCFQNDIQDGMFFFFDIN